MVIASSACTQQWAMTRPRAMVTLPPLLLLWAWPKLWHCINWTCVCIFKLWSFRYLRTWIVITLSTPMCLMNVFELDIIVDGDRWTYYDLGCMYDMWFEILRDFTDYQNYMGLSSMVWLCKWSLLGLISYNLDGSVTVLPPNIEILTGEKVNCSRKTSRLFMHSFIGSQYRMYIKA